MRQQKNSATRRVTPGKQKQEPSEVRYDTMVGARHTKTVKERLVQMANRAGKIYPDFMRTHFERIIAEDDQRLGEN